MKKVFYLITLAGILFTMNGCTTSGYVSSEPSYMEYSRPERPSNLHVWINGDWIYNRQTHVYVQGNGYWQVPRNGRTYIEGRWQTKPQGHRWQSGHWQKR